MASPRGEKSVLNQVNYHEDVKDELAKELAAFAAEGIAVDGVIDKPKRKTVHRTKSAGSSGSRISKDKLKDSTGKSKKVSKDDSLPVIVKVFGIEVFWNNLFIWKRIQLC